MGRLLSLIVLLSIPGTLWSPEPPAAGRAALRARAGPPGAAHLWLHDPAVPPAVAAPDRLRVARAPAARMGAT